MSRTAGEVLRRARTDLGHMRTIRSRSSRNTSRKDDGGFPYIHIQTCPFPIRKAGPGAHIGEPKSGQGVSRHPGQSSILQRFSAAEKTSGPNRTSWGDVSMVVTFCPPRRNSLIMIPVFCTPNPSRNTGSACRKEGGGSEDLPRICSAEHRRMTKTCPGSEEIERDSGPK